MSEANADIELLRVLAKREDFDRYHHLVKPYTLLPEAGQLIEDMRQWYTDNPTEGAIAWPGFLAWMRTTRHPQWRPTQHQQFEAIVNNIASEGTARREVIDRFVELDYATRVRDVVDKVIAGTTNGLAPLDPILTEYRDVSRTINAPPPMDKTTEDLVRTVYQSHGLEWRLEDLNRSVGPLRHGKLVVIGARPEVGKTSFVCSEFTHMANQLPGNSHAIIFNNEEEGDDIRLRLRQAALGATVWDLAADPHGSEARYQTALGGHRIDVFDKTGMTVSDVERVLRTGEYGLICFNTLAKVVGFTKLEQADRMIALGGWARSIAKQYGAVLAVHQADAAAEGLAYLDQSQLYGSKTGLQGEADIQIMVGRTHEPHTQDKRYLNIVKNKAPGGPRTDPALRHGRFEAAFDGMTGRYASQSFPNGATP